MLRVLQQQLHSGRRRSSLLSFQSDLEIHEALGSGGFGRVFRGTWHTAAAAIKVRSWLACGGGAEGRCQLFQRRAQLSLHVRSHQSAAGAAV
jgi:hypothetical protein